MVDWHRLYKQAALSSMSSFQIESLIMRLIELENFDNEFAEHEANEIMYRIESNQLDKITSGFNYGQKDILNHLKKLR